MNTGAITIRAAVSEDAAALSTLAYRSKKSNGYDDADMALFAENLTFTPHRLMVQCFWVAEENDRIIGCIAMASLEKTIAEVRSFYVLPEFKGRGIGRLLWQELLATATSQGVTKLGAEADPASVPIYLHLGCITEKIAASRRIQGRMVPYMTYDIT